jgi:hypothetical protein
LRFDEFKVPIEVTVGISRVSGEKSSPAAFLPLRSHFLYTSKRDWPPRPPEKLM